MLETKKKNYSVSTQMQAVIVRAELRTIGALRKQQETGLRVRHSQTKTFSGNWATFFVETLALFKLICIVVVEGPTFSDGPQSITLTGSILPWPWMAG